MSPGRSITITLPYSHWRAINDLVRASIEPNPREWDRWGEDVCKTIFAAINGYKLPILNEDMPSRPKWNTSDQEPDEEPYEPYTTRDLQNDLGMDFMSDDEFSSWLEDEGDRLD